MQNKWVKMNEQRLENIKNDLLYKRYRCKQAESFLQEGDLFLSFEENLKIASTILNQSLMNNSDMEKVSPSSELFKKTSMRVASEVYRDISKFVNFWPLIKYQDEIPVKDINCPFSNVQITPKTRMLKTRWYENPKISEDDFISFMVQDIAREINREVLNDLRNNALNQLCCNWKSLEDTVISAKNNIHATWMLASPEAVEYLDIKDSSEFTNSFSIRQFADFNGLKVWQDPLVPANQVMLGSIQEDGYWYCPYIPLGKPVQISSLSYGGLITRCAKKLLPNGGRHYAKISVIKS